MHNLNKSLKDQAKDFYNKYKELKHSFVKERKELHIKSNNLERDTKDNIDENIKLNLIHEEMFNEISYLKKKFGMKDKNFTKGI